MLKKLSIVAIALLSAGAAFAQGPSRDEVIAETIRAQGAGEIPSLANDVYMPVPLGTRAKLLAARAAAAKQAAPVVAVQNMAGPEKDASNGFAHLKAISDAPQATVTLYAGK